MDILDIKLWAGSEDALHAYLASVKRMFEAGVSAPEKGSYAYQAEDEKRAPRLFSQQGDVGIVTIAGPLNNTDSWRNEYIGATGYPEIRAALVHAATQEGVKAIVLDIKSGGGAVSGVTDTAELVAMIDAKVKPVHAYSDGVIASAAYWLGSSARTLDIGKVTEAGSLGVLTVHQDLSKMFSEMGVTMTVMRAGKYKALGNAYEPLSDLAKTEIQGQLDQMYGMFVQHVADARGVPYATADQKMGQGRVFVGQAAVDVGLADSITSFDALLSKIQGGIDAKSSYPKYGANFSKGLPVKKALTEQEIAALAAGGTPAADQGDEAARAAAAKAEADAAAAAQAEADAAAQAEAEAAAAAAAQAPASDVVALKAQVDLLTAQVAAAQGQLVDLTVKLQAAESAVAPLKDVITKMRPVAQKSVSNLRVALGQSAAGVDALTDESLLAEHASLSAQFTEKFKVGGVAGVAPADTADKGASTPEPSALKKARLAATRNQ